MTAQTILPANSVVSGGYEVDNSLRFNKASGDYLNRAQATPTSRRKFTYSGWIKICELNIYNILFESANGSHNFQMVIQNNGNGNDFRVYDYVDSTNLSLRTSQAFRDVSAWYHIVLAVDTTQSTASNRVKLYVNGTRVTAFDTETYMDQNYDTAFANGVNMQIGRQQSASDYFQGYMCEVVFIDGSQLAADSFGEFDGDSGIWKPIDVSGLTFGTNGFYLEFKQSGTGTNASGLGADTSGNTNHFAVNNLTAVDQSTDTCTNNFSTLNSLLFHTYSGTYSEGNLKIVASNNSWYADASTIAPSSGKFYMEVKVSAIGNYCALGVGAFPFSNVGHSQLIGELSNTIGWRNNGVLNQNGSAGTSLNSFTTNDIIGMYLDLDNGKFYFSKNGTLESSTGLSLTTGLEYFFVVNPRGSTLELNFGSPKYSVSSSNTDDNDYGNFEYSPNITGDGAAKKFYALNTKNLAEFG